MPDLFCIPPVIDDGANYRRLATALGDDWTVWLLRPDMDLLARKDLFGFDQTVELLLGQVHTHRAPSRPYLLAGYCLGGVLAFKVAQRCRESGCVGLVLFDTPIPGFPHPYPSFRYLHHCLWFLRERRKASGGFSERERLSTTLKRKLTWHLLARTRPLVRHVWHLPTVQAVAAKARLYDLNFFIPLGRLRLPTLHFLAEPGPDLIYGHMRLYWHHHVRAPFRAVDIKNNHEGVFFRNNLPTTSEAIKVWVASLLR